MLFHRYFKQWYETYKDGFVRPVTLNKYERCYRWLLDLAPDVRLCDLDRRRYQQILNKYAQNHERQTTLDFHRHLRASLVDAVEDRLIEFDPTRRAVCKGVVTQKHKIKFLSLEELERLLAELEFDNEPNMDMLIYFISQTGLRYAEALGVTPNDLDEQTCSVRINKTWDYKNFDTGEFTPTKNKMSVRTVAITPKLFNILKKASEGRENDFPIFVVHGKTMFNTLINDRLEVLCARAGINTISAHGLRHTHASLLIYEGVSLPSVSRRLGHSKTSTTQVVFTHFIKEMEAKDPNNLLGILENF